MRSRNVRPKDSIVQRFARLSKFLPFLPVFGGGISRFQPVYVGDIARLVEVISRQDPEISKHLSGKIVEAGGPQSMRSRLLFDSND